MNWIKRLLHKMKSPEKQKEDYQKMLQDARKRFCEYTENPFSTDMRNYMQRVKIESSPTGWGVRTLKPEEIKERLDKGQCWMDYPALNEDGTEMEGVTGINFY